MTNPSKPKVYQGVLEELRMYIKENNLFPGDKLPSERELADKLQAGRSSIREALRALELLGLIETRRGEGTFLRTYQTLQSVELLSSFILLEDGTRRELWEAKRLIEKEAAKLALPAMKREDIEELEEVITNSSAEHKHTILFTYLLKKANNQLLLKIWMLMEEFSQSVDPIYEKDPFYQSLVHALARKDACRIEELYSSKKQANDQ